MATSCPRRWEDDERGGPPDWRWFGRVRQGGGSGRCLAIPVASLASGSLDHGERVKRAVSSTNTKEFPDLSADDLGGHVAKTITAPGFTAFRLQPRGDIAMAITVPGISIGIGACTFADDPAMRPRRGSVSPTVRPRAIAKSSLGGPYESIVSGPSAIR
jgi:hypothetical protein